MEGNFLTTGDLALWEQRNERWGHRGTSTTGLALACGLGGGALLLSLAGLWGLNKASEARCQCAQRMAEGNATRLNSVSAEILAERASREGWERMEMPSIRQYVDVQTHPSLNNFNAAMSTAEALAYAQAINRSDNALGSAVASSNYLRVQPISVKDCGCGCNG